MRNRKLGGGRGIHESDAKLAIWLLLLVLCLFFVCLFGGSDDEQEESGEILHINLFRIQLGRV